MSEEMTRDEADQKTRKQIEEADELGLYFMINEIGGFVWRMNHDMADGRIPEKDWPMIDEEIARLRPLQTFAVSQLTRIGVETPLKEDGKSLQMSTGRGSDGGTGISRGSQRTSGRNSSPLTPTGTIPSSDLRENGSD